METGRNIREHARMSCCIFVTTLINLNTLTNAVVPSSTTEARPETNLEQHCQLESFQASCDHRDDTEEGGVIVMTKARYGRMQLGRCVKRDWGYIGCAADVLPHLDRVCSGKRNCQFPVADLNGNQPCPGDLAPYLETAYKCIKVAGDSPMRCAEHAPITLTSQSGYLASVVAMETGVGGSDCPWRIEVHHGQQVNLTLINFSRVGFRHPSEVDGSTPPASNLKAKVCYQFANIREKRSSRMLTECEGGGARISHAYTSSTNQIEVEMVTGKVHKIYFLLHFKAVGCADPRVSAGMWLRREGEFAIVRCNSTGFVSRLKCRTGSTSWEGHVENCSRDPFGDPLSIGGFQLSFDDASFPYSVLAVVAVGVSLGVFVGGLLLVLFSRYFKRRLNCNLEYGVTSSDNLSSLYQQHHYQQHTLQQQQRHMQQWQHDYICTGDVPSLTAGQKTIVLSCDLMTPTSLPDVRVGLPSDDTSDYQTSNPRPAPCHYAIYDKFSTLTDAELTRDLPVRQSSTNTNSK